MTVRTVSRLDHGLAEPHEVGDLVRHADVRVLDHDRLCPGQIRAEDRVVGMPRVAIGDRVVPFRRAFRLWGRCGDFNRRGCLRRPSSRMAVGPSLQGSLPPRLSSGAVVARALASRRRPSFRGN